MASQTKTRGGQLDIVDVASALVNDGSALAVLTADLATFAQGALADSAVQPADNVSDLANDAFYQGRTVPGTVGDFAALDVNGDLIAGGSQASDFATAAQGALADSSLQNTTDTFTGVLTITGTADVSGGVNRLRSATTAVDVSAAAAPTVGQILTAVNGTLATWQNAPTPIDAYLKLESDAAAGNAGAKINKVSAATTGNFAEHDATGQLQAGTSAAADFATAAQGGLADSALQPAAIGVTVQAFDATYLVDADIGGSVEPFGAAYTKAESNGTAGSAGAKTDKLVPATTGDFAALNAAGNIIDGGAQASDFATAAQGSTADTAQQPTPTASTAELEAIANAINTTVLKIAGYMVFNITTAKPVWAGGAADASVWYDATGTIAHTPIA